MESASNYVIGVCFGNSNVFEEKLKRLFRGLHVTRFVIVDTSKGLEIGGVFVAHEQVNALFEFSGYQYGLRCIQNMESADQVRCFVINDTVFKVHLESLFRRMVLLESRRDVDGLCVSGMVESRFIGPIIPSCFFVLSGKGSVVGNLQLVPMQCKSLADAKSLNLYKDPAFTLAVERWLRPKRFLRGWYKAKYFTPISVDEFERKVVAICLEWNLVGLLKQQGATLYDHRRDWGVEVLKFIDKCFCNVLKIKNRLREFFLLKFFGRYN